MEKKLIFTVLKNCKDYEKPLKDFHTCYLQAENNECAHQFVAQPLSNLAIRFFHHQTLCFHVKEQFNELHFLSENYLKYFVRIV